MADIVVEARQLKRSFNKGKFVAVNGLSLDIKYGQIHALLGPNGAGKTTTVKMLTTLLQPDSGSVKIAGVDAVKNPTSARRKLAQVLQDVQLGQCARVSRSDQPDWRGQASYCLAPSYTNAGQYLPSGCTLPIGPNNVGGYLNYHTDPVFSAACLGRP